MLALTGKETIATTAKLPFGDNIMTTALLDRLTSKGHTIEFIGESYRFRQRIQMEEQAVSAQAR